MCSEIVLQIVNVLRVRDKKKKEVVCDLDFDP
jgi:hypothetical protein